MNIVSLNMNRICGWKAKENKGHIHWKYIAHQLNISRFCNLALEVNKKVNIWGAY